MTRRRRGLKIAAGDEQMSAVHVPLLFPRCPSTDGTAAMKFRAVIVYSQFLM
jgi:hypothetical protein